MCVCVRARAKDKRLLISFCCHYDEAQRAVGVVTWRLKVKVHPVRALSLCTGCTAHGGSRGIALPFLDHGTRRG